MFFPQKYGEMELHESFINLPEQQSGRKSISLPETITGIDLAGKQAGVSLVYIQANHNIY